MKIQVWGEKEADVTLRVKLMDNGSGGVKLVSVDADGDDTWNLLGISGEGKLYLYAAIGEDLGLCLDKNDCIKLDKESR